MPWNARPTRQACGRIDLAELHALATELRRLRTVKRDSAAKFIDQARAVDSRLHDLIAHSAGNKFLAKELSRLKILFRAFRDVSYIRHEERNDLRRLAEEAHEHLAIVEALLAGDKNEAAQAMARHIRSGFKYWTRSLPDVVEASPQRQTASRSTMPQPSRGIADRRPVHVAGLPARLNGSSG